MKQVLADLLRRDDTALDIEAAFRAAVAIVERLADAGRLAIPARRRR
jgi:hypothetical protein